MRLASEFMRIAFWFNWSIFQMDRGTRQPVCWHGQPARHRASNYTNAIFDFFLLMWKAWLCIPRRYTCCTSGLQIWWADLLTTRIKCPTSHSKHPNHIVKKPFIWTLWNSLRELSTSKPIYFLSFWISIQRTKRYLSWYFIVAFEPFPFWKHFRKETLEEHSS